MCRLLLLIIGLLTYAESHHHRHRHRCYQGRSNPRQPDPENQLEVIEQNFIQQDIAFQIYCAELLIPSNGSRELYGSDRYFLKYRLPEAMTPRVTVQIRYKFIHTTVENFENGRTSKIFEDVKILPDMVNPEDAVWSMGNDDLTIAIPYKVPLGTETVMDCGGLLNGDFVLNVPAVMHPNVVLRNQMDSMENAGQN